MGDDPLPLREGPEVNRWPGGERPQLWPVHGPLCAVPPPPAVRRPGATARGGGSEGNCGERERGGWHLVFGFSSPLRCTQVGFIPGTPVVPTFTSIDSTQKFKAILFTHNPSSIYLFLYYIYIFILYTLYFYIICILYLNILFYFPPLEIKSACFKSENNTAFPRLA